MLADRTVARGEVDELFALRAVAKRFADSVCKGFADYGRHFLSRPFGSLSLGLTAKRVACRPDFTLS